ncbi:TPA: hypothetical protein N0G50_004196 [Pseudomonas aeruginosa]|nr:hypothetical protein [Pseudomonas aeruginosa]
MNKALDLLREIRPSIPKEVLELWCKDRDAFLASHPAVEQAGGDERAALQELIRVRDWVKNRRGQPEKLKNTGQTYIMIEKCETLDMLEWAIERARAALAQPSPAQAEQHWPKLEKPAQVGAIRFRAGLSSRLVVEAAQRLYEFESTPEKEAERIERLQAFREQCFEPLGAEFSKVLSENLVELSSEAKPEQAEAERPEVVARVVHSNPAVLGQCGPLNANDELMTVAQHAASVARWAEMFNRVEQQRDSALARVAELEAHCVRLGQGGAERYWENRWRDADARLQELEKQEPVATVAKVPGEDWNSLDFHRDLQDMQPGTKLYTAPVAQAQHSVPDHAELLQALERTHAGHMVGHDQSDQPKGGYSDGYVNGFGECIKVARKVLAAAPVCRLSRSALTDAQMRRLYENSTEAEKEHLGFAAFARLMRLAEAVHQIAAAPAQGGE